MELIVGNIYYLKNFTSPKVFNGLYFECLSTEQKIPANVEVETNTFISLEEWKGEIYKPERFCLTLKTKI